MGRAAVVPWVVVVVALGGCAVPADRDPVAATTANSPTVPPSVSTGDNLPGEGVVVITVDVEPCTAIPLASPELCAPQPLPGVPVVVTDGSRTTGTTGTDGTLTIALPPGRYRVDGAPVAGYAITSRPVTVSVEEGHAVVALLSYSRGFQ